MPNTETLVWVLTGALTLISVLSGVIWNMIRSEAKEQGELIKLKADTERLHEIESRWSAKLESVESNNERLIDKLSQRHDKEIDQVSARLSDQIRATESTILRQLELMLQMIRKD